jgi:AmiR/NasT family two-component response regulator
VEALTGEAAEARRRLDSRAVIERASLEDIMVLMEKGD